jgi:hypothetical protein
MPWPYSRTWAVRVTRAFELGMHTSGCGLFECGVLLIRTEEGEVMLVTLFAKGDMGNIPVAKLKEIRRALEI